MKRVTPRHATLIRSLVLVLAATALRSQTMAQGPGSLDPTFDGDGKILTEVSTSAPDYATGVAVQSDGKIVVAGWSSLSNSTFAVVRHNTNGSLDTTFGTGGKVTTSLGSGSAYAEAVAIQSDQRIVVVGRYYDGAAYRFAVVRYTTTGALDTTFNSAGKVLTSFGSTDDEAFDVAIQSSDQKIVVAGRSWSGAETDFAVARYTTAGALDTSFNVTGKRTIPVGAGEDYGSRVAINSSTGTITIGGYAQDGPYVWNIGLARVGSTGALDTSFNTTGTAVIPIDNFLGVAGFGMALQSDGKLVVGTRVSIGSPPANTADVAVARITTGGTLDASFGTGGIATADVNGGKDDSAYAVAMQPDGKIVVAGITEFYGPGAVPKAALLRFTSAGLLDATFGGTGVVFTDVPVYAETITNDYRMGTALQGDGKVLVATTATNVSVPGDRMFAALRYMAADVPEITVEDTAGSSLVDGTGTIGFGNVGTGVTSAPKTVTIRNVGTLDLTGLSLTKNGTNAGDFANSALLVTSLPPGGSTTFTVTCTPSASGARAAALHIASNDADENPFDIALSGTGVVPSPEIAIRDASGNELTDAGTGFVMGAAPVGRSFTETLTIANTGSANLTGLSVSVDGADAAQFVAGAPVSTTLAPGGSTTFAITFLPASTGSKSAAIHVGSNDADENPFDISVRGGGIATALTALHKVKAADNGAASFIETYNAPTPCVMANGWLVFIANEATTGGGTYYTLWRSDGTDAGTAITKPATTGVGVPAFSPTPPMSPMKLVTFNNAAYCLAGVMTDGFYGSNALWKCDGTAAGTVIVKSGLTGSDSGGMVAANGLLFFTADDGTNGVELWKSNGTNAGTVMVKDIRTGGPAPMNGSYPQQLTRVGNVVFFTADDGTNGRELWKSDGTSVGTVLVKNIRSGSAGAFDNNSNSLTYSPLTESGGLLFFTADDGSNGYELWKSDGTAAGTVMVKDIVPGSGSGAGPTPMDGNSLTDVNGTLFFVGGDSSSGREIWKSNGTTAGTVLVKDIAPGSSDSYPRNLMNLGGNLYALAFDDTFDGELWKSDGSPAGTVRVKNVNPGDSSYPYPLAYVGGKVFFAADDGAHGNELWISDGTEAGTSLLADLNPGMGGSSPALAAVVGTRLYFVAGDPATARELYVINVGPDIAIEHPLGTDLTAGVSSIDFGPAGIGSNLLTKTFFIKNAGTGLLTLGGPSTTGGNAGDFVVNSNGMNIGLAPGASTTITVSFIPTATGTRGTTLRFSSNDGDENPFDITLTGTGLTQQQGWRYVFFGISTNSGDAADDADPDHDGLANLLEWACDLPPITANTLPTPLTNNGGVLEFLYTRNTIAVNTGVIFTVEWSDTMVPGSWSTSGVTQAVLTDNGSQQQMKATMPAGNGERFVRLRVAAAP